MASTLFKKREGLLSFAKNQVVWTPTTPPGSKPEVTIPISNVTNLQQTPPDKAKVMLRIFAQSSGSIEPVIYQFSFTSSAQARAEADSLRDSLSTAIQVAKTDGSIPAAPGGEGSSAAMAIASAVSKPGLDGESWYDEECLRTSIELQQSLLKANPSLSKTFVESLRTKPESISNSQFTGQFWSSRLNLLRAHAIERGQSKGEYNVLSAIKSRTEDNVAKLDISREQINLIFSQHPLVKRVYDENVPKLSEEAFWTRFFQSRLLKKLKGERITEIDSKDAVLDKYLTFDDNAAALQKRLLLSHVPHIIDVHGNEENHSQRKGNAPDLLMRPTSMDRMPIIRTLNSLSEKIMSHVAPNDVDPSEPIGMDEETFNFLALRDLQSDAVENRIILNVKDQGRFFSSKENDADPSSIYAKQDPRKTLRMLKGDLASFTNLDLRSKIGVDDDSDSDSDDEKKESTHMGSRASFRAASTQIFTAIVEQRAQNDDLSSNDLSTVQSASTFSLSPTVFDRLALTHATTTEFLHHFWKAFLSGDPLRAEEIRSLVETLNRSMDRIKAVASDAEAERAEKVEALKKSIRDYYERTRRKKPFDPETVKGGAKAVNQLMNPTVEAIRIATGKYAEALAEQEAAIS